MKNFAKHVVIFIKKEIVFTIAAALAIVSSIIIKPGISVIDGIDFRTLVLLFSLMAVVAGLQRQAVFVRIGNALISKINSTRTLYLILILLCFTFAMFLTNDVALITFVPFSIMILPMAGQKEKLPVIIVLQTLAANLGSVLTPLGNPQNLYLYNISCLTMGQFMLWMLPLWIVSLVLVVAPVFFMSNESISKQSTQELPPINKIKQIMYILLFVVSLCCVLKILDYRILFAIILVAVIAFDRQTIGRVDYILLLTFVGFFVFIYNMKQVPAFVNWISNVVNGHEFIVGVLSSQVISNVPAALLLSGFTDNLKTLLVAVNVGGLGTIIASMASLISYKLYCASKDSKSGSYMALFTIFNFAYLIFIFAFCKLWYQI